MPRYSIPMNSAHQERQRRYRARLRAAGIPEADAVDSAVAEAVAVAVCTAASEGRLAPDGQLARLMRDAVQRLVDAGYDLEAARHKTKRRMGRFGYHVTTATG